MSLAVRLTAIFLALSLVPLAVVGYLGFSQGRDSIERDTRLRLSSVTALREALYNQWATDNESRLRELANRSSLEALVTVLMSRESSTEEYLEARSQVVDEHFVPAIAEGGFTSLLLLRGGDGLVLATTDDPPFDRQAADQPYLVEGRTGTYVQFVYQLDDRDDPLMTIGTPIRMGSEAVAVLAADLDLGEMSEVLTQRNTAGTTGETYLVSPTTFFLTNPATAGGFSVRDTAESDELERCRSNPAAISLYDNQRGEPVIGAQRWMPRFELCIRTEVKQATAFGRANELRGLVLGIGAIVALIVSIIGLLLARSVTRPIDGLVRGTAEVGRGNLSYQIPGWSASDEIGQLTRAFNDMTQNLRSITTSRDELNNEVTERKRAEEALAEQAEELARSNAELGQFAYVASHDLQEPLRMVASYMQLIDRRYRGKLDDQADEFIEFAVDGAHRMQQLISDLLEFSRVGTHGQGFEQVDSQKLFAEAVSNLRLAIEESGATVTHDEFPVVMADPRQLGRVFQNLIGNALKYRGERTPEVHVGAISDDDEWVFSVRDNGIGIDPEYHERIFGIFERLHARGEYSGTGIGLAICKKIVERHGGRIWIEFEPDSYTIFYFSIPAADSNG